MIEIIPNWHPLMVHFTIALLSLSIVFFVLQKFLYETEIGDNFNVFARYSLFLGVFISILTVTAGWFAYNSVDHDTPSHVAMTDHRLFGIITFIVFVIAAIWLASSSSMRETTSVPFIVVLLIGGVLLMTTGYKGAELVYKYGLGVQSLPKSESHDHASGQDHDGEHAHSDDQAHKETDDHAHDDSDHAHSEDEMMKIDEQSMADMEKGMADASDAEMLKPAVVVDKDGISQQALPAEVMPMQDDSLTDKMSVQ